MKYKKFNETLEEKEERLNDFKKVALRFLKDAGLYNWWIKYIRYEDKLGNYLGLPKPYKNNWYNAKHIDTIFGRTRFTMFLRQNGIHLPVHTVYIFRYYIHIVYGDDIYPVDRVGAFDGLEKNDSGVQIDPINKTIKIKIKHGNIQE